jgi:DNA polymerase IV
MSSESPSQGLLFNKIRSPKSLAGVKLYVIDSKLASADAAHQRALAAAHGKLVGTPEEADVVITAIRMRTRLERHMTWDTAVSIASQYVISLRLLMQRNKVVVTPQWLVDSVAHGSPLTCDDYVALNELQTAQSCAACECEDYQTSDEDQESDDTNDIHVTLGKRKRSRCTKCDCRCERNQEPSSASAQKEDGRFPTPPSSPDIILLSRAPTPLTELPTVTPVMTSHEPYRPSQPARTRPSAISTTPPTYLLSPSTSPSTDLGKLRPDASMACQRASPLVCHNQGLVETLDVIRRSRYLEGETRSELSYMRAIAAIKGIYFPRVLIFCH